MFSRQSGKSFGTARGLGEKTSCTIWSSTKLMPIVASSGAIRARPCSGRSPMRSISNADQRAGDEDDRHRHRQRRMQKRDRRPADIGADRIDRAMGEIDQIGDAENQRQPDREQRVDVADDEAVDRIVDE